MITTEFEARVLDNETGYRDGLLFDAVRHLDGIAWYRVQGGFGSQDSLSSGSKREDWVAGVGRGAAISVNRHHAKDGYGWDGDLSFVEAARREIDRYAKSLPFDREKYIDRLHQVMLAQDVIRNSQEYRVVYNENDEPIPPLYDLGAS